MESRSLAGRWIFETSSRRPWGSSLLPPDSRERAGGRPRLMTLAELLTPERILLPLEADTLEEGMVAVARQLGSDAAELKEVKRELRAPSPRSVVWLIPGDSRPGAVLGISPDPLPGAEGQAVRIILAIRLGGGQGLESGTVRTVVSTLADPEIEAGLLTAGSVGEIMRVERLMSISLRGQQKVRDALTPMSYRIYPDTPLSEVADLMARKNLAAVPVVGEGLQVLGIITSGEALQHALGSQGRGGATIPGIRARDVMSRAVLCVTEDQDLLDAAKMMANRDLAQLPVVREGEMVGFLTREAVLRALLSGSG
ncbi:MAG: CBS domain-containing protein [Gemmatimonadales bacterium]|nr:MAG: CBS domain-containing protein [Gemmatimonadales bacterium]